MLFGLNCKLPMLYETKNDVDTKIRETHAEIGRLNLMLSAFPGPRKIAAPRKAVSLTEQIAQHEPKLLEQSNGGPRLSTGWPADPEERKAESARRRAKWGKGKGKRSRKSINHPRNPDHPKHEQWLAKLRAGQKRFMESLSPYMKKKRINSMLEARAAGRASA